jgi:hypothetical protein
VNVTGQTSSPLTQGRQQHTLGGWRTSP